ncbi:MAG: TetR/AcrR family transcriptional regulator [Actinomycetia bacterium]|nr:TetR/AcrR family transcriptional regulator [Actinomycetes bacterium]MCP4957952.1 TetR/AcrR family transcriptional regulator [Actinomycetes bacterium]
MARKLSREARDKMVTAAMEVIGELGVDGFTVDEVARRSGVAKTTIYRHFESGPALAVHALNGMLEKFPSIDTGTLRGDLETFGDHVRPQFNDPATRTVIAGVLAMSANEREFGEIHRQIIDERKAPLIRAFQRAIARGELDPETDLDLAHDMLEGTFVFRRILLDQIITEADSLTIIGMVLKAIGAED